MSPRPPFIVAIGDLPERAHVYPQSEERMGPVRRAGKAAGLIRIGVNLQRLPPGTRSSWPHAEEDEEEFVYVMQGAVDAWIDGDLHRMVAGDLAAFPAGTGICHCFINNTDSEALLLVGGDAARAGSRITYPLNPSRRADMGPSDWWEDAPARKFGPHDGLPDALRGRLADGAIRMGAATFRPAGVAWVGLYAKHLPTLADFYEKVVGFKVVEHSEDCCMFDAGAGATFELWGKGFASSARKTPQEQSTLVGFLVEHLEPVVAALRARGLQPDTEIDSYAGTRWIYYTDPEGNRFELKDRQG